MPIELSVLNSESIADILMKEWKICVSSISTIQNCTANCFIINAHSQKYFLKEFQPSYDIQRAISEEQLLSFLKKHNFPASIIIPTISGNAFVEYGGRILQLQEFFEGNVPRQNTLEQDTVIQAAQLLGKLNVLLKNYELPIAMGKDWLLKYNKNEYEQFYNETLLQLKTSNIEQKIYEKIETDIEFRLLINQQMDEYQNYFDKITYASSHGDYIYSQLICEDNQIKRIIDFSYAHSVPLALELMRFFTLSSNSFSQIKEMNYNLLKSYIGAYLSYFPLSRDDLRYMPYIYLYYMGRNKFLYREFIQKKNNNLFHISSWRSDICRLIYDNAENISNQLIELL